MCSGTGSGAGTGTGAGAGNDIGTGISMGIICMGISMGICSICMGTCTCTGSSTSMELVGSTATAATSEEVPVDEDNDVKDTGGLFACFFNSPTAVSSSSSSSPSLALRLREPAATGPTTFFGFSGDDIPSVGGSEEISPSFAEILQITNVNMCSR